MSSRKLTPKERVWAGILFFGTGAAIILASVDIIPIDEADLHAPHWVLGLCGLVFSLAGVMIFLGDQSKWNNLLAGILIFSMGSIGGWIALFGSGSNFSGGIALLSNESNTSLARWVFGIGSVICFATAFHAVKLYFKGEKK